MEGLFELGVMFCVEGELVGCGFEVGVGVGDVDVDLGGMDFVDFDCWNFDLCNVIDQCIVVQKWYDVLVVVFGIVVCYDDMFWLVGVLLMFVVYVDVNDFVFGIGWVMVVGFQVLVLIGVVIQVVCMGVIQWVLFDEGCIVGMIVIDWVFMVYQCCVIIV